MFITLRPFIIFSSTFLTGFSLSKLGGWRRTISRTGPLEMICLWWGTTLRWCGIPATRWGAGLPTARMQNRGLSTTMFATTVPCEHTRLNRLGLGTHVTVPYEHTRVKGVWFGDACHYPM